MFEFRFPLCWFIGLLLVLHSPYLVDGQGTAADYERMEGLRDRYRNKVFRDRIEPNWLPGNRHFWYRVRTGTDSHEFILVDLTNRSRRPAFDHPKLAAELTQQSETEFDPAALPLDGIEFSNDRSTIGFRFGGETWKWNRGTGQLTKSESSGASQNPGPFLTELKPSESEGGRIEIEFINEREEAIELIWIDTRWQRQSYHVIPPGEKVTQGTFVGHVWLIADPRGRPLAAVEATESAPAIRIGSDKELPELSMPRRRGWGRRRNENRSTGLESPNGNSRLRIDDRELLLENGDAEPIQLAKLPDRDGISWSRRAYWSPDSRFVIALESSAGANREIHMIESAPDDQLQPKLHTMRYLKPGDDIEQDRIRLFDASSGVEVDVDNELFPNPWRLSRMNWNDDSSEFSFLYNQRGHQTVRLIGINAETGRARTIVDETLPTFVDYTNKVYVHDVSGSDELIWMSEREGWNHLYLFDRNSGELKNRITSGEWVVREVERVDDDNRQIWFTAGGIVPGQDPYYIHHCRVDFDGQNLVVLTDGDGTHQIEWSPDRRFIIDRYSRVDLAPVTTVRDGQTGELICELETGDTRALVATGWQTPRPFSAPGRDGKTPIYGVIYLPTHFSEDQSYPVIEYIYAGPQGAFVPKSFRTLNQMQELAELGFIVVQIDGMGTNYRSKAFHDVCWKNLGDAGFPDRIAWMKAAAEKIPQMNLDRVGIYGGSAGGQNALRGLLAHGDFYDVGVSDCGCHDNRMDKIWWNEQWMGWPIGDHYAEQSNVTQAHRLEGKLFLIVGELDRNVDPASTMQVVDALIKANKDFDLLVVPGGGHGVGGGRYGRRRTRDFFVRHLLDVEPRSEPPNAQSVPAPESAAESR